MQKKKKKSLVKYGAEVLYHIEVANNQNKWQSFTTVDTKRKLTLNYLCCNKAGGYVPLPILFIAYTSTSLPRWKPALRKIWQDAWPQQAVYHHYLPFSVGGETVNCFSSLFSWIPQGIKNFLAGGFHFLITLFIHMIYAIFYLVL